MDQVLSLPLSKIKIDFDFNSRKIYGQESIDQLRQSIEKNGQDTPVTVVLTNNPKVPYELITGFKRAKAISQSKKIEEIKAIVKSVSDDSEKFESNLRENLEREDLSTYEVALSLKRLRDDYKLTANQISTKLAGSLKIKSGKKTGFSKGHINNLISTIEVLHPEILDEWKNGNPNCSLLYLNQIKSLTKEEQIENWLDLTSSNALCDSESSDKEDKKSGTAKNNKPGIVKLIEALQYIQNNDDDASKGAASALRFAIGKTKTIRNGKNILFNPKNLVE